MVVVMTAVVNTCIPFVLLPNKQMRLDTSKYIRRIAITRKLRLSESHVVRCRGTGMLQQSDSVFLFTENEVLNNY